jgi:NAD(P)-dependent dehydrogenase (short-subunit alcohol dehydrogenase family)
MGQYNLCSTLPVDDWRRLLDVNVIGAVLCSRYCRHPMAARGGGVILNQSSSSAHQGVGAYSVSKLALEAVTLSLATEFAEDHIRVVGVAPGMIGSNAVMERLEQHNKDLVLSGQLIKRFATVEDLFGVVLLLCSGEASFVTGQTYPVDGGFPRRV